MNPGQQGQATNYGDSKICVLVRDPQWLFVYWEIQNEAREKALAKLAENAKHTQTILRVYEKNRGRLSSFDIELEGFVNSRYIEVKPKRSFVVEIGLLSKKGRFVPLARSNQVATPQRRLCKEANNWSLFNLKVENQLWVCSGKR